MPLMMDMTTMRVVVAITTPRRVRKERSLCARKASRAIQKASRVVPHKPTPALDRARSACGSEVVWSMEAIEDSKLETRNSKLEARNWKLVTRNSKLVTRNSQEGSRISSFDFPVSNFQFRSFHPFVALDAAVTNVNDAMSVSGDVVFVGHQ